jgi:HNH endonuclease
MATGFNRDEVAALLVKCHRRCCICHRYCGTKIETDHIVPAAESNDHSIENAIPVCFDCHAEIHAYNPKHPRGRKFTPEELRLHKKQWLFICETKPEIFLEASRNVDIGPIQGMLDELDHNFVILDELKDPTEVGFRLKDKQFSRAIREGVLSMLDDNWRKDVSRAYAAISGANEKVRTYASSIGRHGQRDNLNTAFQACKNAIPIISAARDRLLSFVQSEDS